VEIYSKVTPPHRDEGIEGADETAGDAASSNGFEGSGGDIIVSFGGDSGVI
jgi:hypothetical protein